MRFLRTLVIAIALLVVLHFVKKMVDHSGAFYTEFLRNLLANLQLFILLGTVFFGLAILVNLVGRKKTFTLVRLSLVYLALLVVAEIAFAFLLNKPAKIPKAWLPAFREYYGHYNCNLIEFDKGSSQYDSQLSYLFHPNDSFEFNNYEFSTRYNTNRLGLRDDNNALTKPQIVFLGDSYTMGWGVEQHETLSALVGNQTGKRTINTGLASYGTARELMNASRLDLSETEFVIIQYSGNDSVENSTYVKNNFQLPIRPESSYDSLCRSLEWRISYYPFKHCFTLPRLLSRHYMKDGPEQSRLSAEYSDHFKISNDKIVDDFKKILERFSEKKRDLKFIVFNTTDHHLKEFRFITGLEKAMQASDSTRSLFKNIYLVDITDEIDQSDHFVLDWHLNRKGYQKIARILTTKIASIAND
jgi:hypothetical protein